MSIGAGTIFRLGGGKKMNDFSVGDAKIGEKQDNQIQSITLCSM